MAGETIALLEDEADTLEAVESLLSRSGYRVISAVDGLAGLDAVLKHLPSLVLLDLGLPRLVGMVGCRRLRANSKTRSIPLIMHTTRSDEDDIIRGLEAGADDYVPKTASSLVLVARIEAVLRRVRAQSEQDVENPIVRRGLIVDGEARTVSVDDQAVSLSGAEFRLLHFLLSHPARAFTRDALLDEMVGQDSFVVDRNIDVRVASIRRKIGPYRGVIETLRGIGYRSVFL